MILYGSHIYAFEYYNIYIYIEFRDRIYKFKHSYIGIKNMILYGTYINLKSNNSISVQIKYIQEILCNKFNFFENKNDSI